MSPFEMNLRNELHIERQRFANKWLFPWHNINIPNRVVDVEDFRGGKFAVGGIKFEGQIQELYWQAIVRYLIAKVHETFRRWEEETRLYPANMRGSSLEGTRNLLMKFVAEITEQATDTDRRLRGKGSPNNVSAYNAGGEQSHVKAEISRLVDSHRAMIESTVMRTRLSPIQRLEAMGRSHRAKIAILGLIVALIGLALAVAS